MRPALEKEERVRRRRARQQALRAKHIALGLCTRCNRTLAPGSKANCATHLETSNVARQISRGKYGVADSDEDAKFAAKHSELALR